MKTHFELEHYFNQLDEYFSQIGGGGRPHGSGRPHGAGLVRPTVVRTPQQRHTAMVSRYYRHNPLGGRRVRITPYGSRWFMGGGGYLYGFPYTYWYPFFDAISSGDELQEAMLKAKYNISDADWADLVNRLVSDGYITYQ